MEQNNNFQKNNYSSSQIFESDTNYSNNNNINNMNTISNNNNYPKIIQKIIFYKEEYLQPYYKISTKEIYQRLQKSLNPLTKNFFIQIKTNPDIYGPFWIYSSIIYLLAIKGALYHYFTNYSTNYFDSFLLISCSIFYFFCFGSPLILFLYLKKIGNETNSTLIFVDLVCICGYSMSCYLGSIVIYLISFQYLEWISLGYGFFCSTWFLINNLLGNDDIKNLESIKKKIFFGIVLINQISFFLVLKVYFYGNFIIPPKEYLDINK